MIVTSVPSLARMMTRGTALAQRIRVRWRRFWAPPGASFRVVYVEDGDARDDDPAQRPN